MSKDTVIEKAHDELRAAMAEHYSHGMEIEEIYSWAAEETGRTTAYLKQRHRLSDLREFLRNKRAAELAISKC